MPNNNFPDEEKWIRVKHNKLLHRKTFIAGRLISKYYGELDYLKDAEGFVREKYFDFTLYDAQIRDSLFRLNNEGPFHEFPAEDIFPGKISPIPLPCKISYKDIEGEFEINLYDLKLANIDFNKNRALHQDEEDEVFGTVEARITGYILEEFIETYEEDLKVQEVPSQQETEPAVTGPNPEHVEPIKTGRTKKKGDYIYNEYWSQGKKSFWGRPEYVGMAQGGCIESFWSLLSIIIFIIFLVSVGPAGILTLILMVFIWLAFAYLSDVFRWLLRIVGIVFAFFSILAFLSFFKKSNAYVPQPFSKDEPTEVKKTEQGEENKNDSLIIHHRVWKDYEGQQYEGDFWIKVRDYRSSNVFKNALAILPNSKPGYDQILFELKNQDSSKLNGVYLLLDSIRLHNGQSDIRFAETIVSFIQDIPYVLVLDNDCNASLYNDAFIKAYLETKQGACSGYQKFGINTPVEFMATLDGDCDSRTLLLYTILSHYKYDVALLSSEYYSHSILGINLPLSGKSLSVDGHDYIAWETTAPGIRAGILPAEISDFSNWRISLKSKL
ncbi:MAG: hypothetical protein ABIT81_01005 [Ferruginibacter sp.]